VTEADPLGREDTSLARAQVLASLASTLGEDPKGTGGAGRCAVRGPRESVRGTTAVSGRPSARRVRR
jgi:hypothetical protein